MLAVKEIVWVAGLLEGEGCFSIHSATALHREYRVELCSTDLDIIKRYISITKPTHNIYERKLRLGHKQEYYIRLTGSKAIQWMMTIYPIMGLRRKAKIQEIIADWKKHIAIGSGICRTCKYPLKIKVIKTGWNKGKRQTYCQFCKGRAKKIA